MDHLETLDLGAAGDRMHAFMTELFPLCRSITGEGLRSTLRAIGKRVPIEITEVPTGTEVFDWVVPKEWNIRDAYVKNPRGEKVIDFQRSNLHVLNYSVPVREELSLDELKPHLYSLPDQPDLVPYRTSYYKEAWGFCLAHADLERLEEGHYEVVIDSTLEPGSLSLGEVVVEGRLEDEVLISCHSCHPSIANDNLSGIALATELAEHLTAGPKPLHTFRFLFIPGTIGSITWLALNEERTSRIKAGLVVTCVGDPGNPTYKRSRRHDALIDRAAEHVLGMSGSDFRIVDFTPYGYDERQYCSPGFNLPVGSLTRTPNGEYSEYHTSADNLDFTKPDALADSLRNYVDVLDVIENDAVYVNQEPKGEPQLGKRGLYESTGGTGAGSDVMAKLWVLNLCDGEHGLLDIARRSGLSFREIKRAARALYDAGLLERAPSSGGALPGR
jgi:aminopeptidase-like protein